MSFEKVKKNETLIREIDKEYAEPLEVICADEEIFIVARLTLKDNEAKCALPDYTRIEAFKNSLEALQENQLTRAIE